MNTTLIIKGNLIANKIGGGHLYQGKTDSPSAIIIKGDLEVDEFNSNEYITYVEGNIVAKEVCDGN